MSLSPPDRLHRFASVLESSEVAVIGNNLGGIITDWNKGAEQLYGYLAEEVLGRPASLLIPPDRSDDLLEVMRTVLRGESVAHHETIHQKKDGGRLDLSLSVTPIRNDAGGIVGAVAIVRDIGERKRRKLSEQELRASEERLRLAARAGRMYAYEWDVATDVVKRSPEYLDILGLEEEPTHLTRQQLLDRVHPEDRSKFLAAIAEVTPENPHLDLTYRMLRPGGGVVWLEKSAHAFFDKQGKMLRMIGMVADITERKLAEDALLVSQDRLRLALRAGRMYTWEWNAETDRIARSPECSTIYRESLFDTGEEFFLRVHPEDRERYRSIACDLSLERPSYYQVNYRVRRPDGNILWLEEAGHALFGAAGKLLRVVGITADVTSRKLADEAIKDLTGRLLTAQEEERSRIARELHDDICQRIAILTVELAGLDAQSPAAQIPDSVGNFHDQIQSLGERLSDVGRDLQTLSHRLHSPQLEHLGLARTAANFCKDLSAQQKVEINFSGAGIPNDISTETSLCLFRVLQEALQNAVKHSGVRHFWVELFGSSEAVQLTVSDRGVGFDLNAVDIKRHGLGLISMRERLHLANGEFSVMSEPGRGTTLSARIPLGAIRSESTRGECAS